MIRKLFLFWTTILFCSITSAQHNTKNVDSIALVGLKRTKASFIKRIIKVKENQSLDSLLIKEDILRLKRLPGIAHASYELIENNTGKTTVKYTFEENFTIIPGLNIYTTNNGEFAIRTALFEFNLFGENMLFGGYYLRDVFDSYGVFWEAPYLFSNKWGLGVNHINSITQEPVFFRNNNADFRYRNTSFEAYLLYEHNFNNKAEFGISYIDEKYDFIEGTVPNEIPTTIEGDKIQYRFEYEFNNVDVNFQNFSGIKNTLQLRLVGESNELLNNFLIARNDLSYYKRIGKRGNWASRLRLGIATNEDTPFAPFAVDNNLNIRGVGNTIDRGTATTILNTEYRHTLYEKGWFVLQGNAFVDAGSWRNPRGELKELVDGSTFRVYPGLGFRLIHKRIFNAVFRLDYGYGVTKNSTNGIVFGIGQYF